MKKFKILIIGVNGFTGKHLAEHLLKNKAILVFGADIHSDCKLMPELESYHKMDITIFDEIFGLISLLNPDQIFNLAGITGGDSRMMFSVNIQGVINLLDAVLLLNKKNISMLFVGTSAEYGEVHYLNQPIIEETICNPQNIYGISKYSATLIIQHYSSNYNLRAVIVRPFNIIGYGVPENLFIGALINRIRNRLSSGSKEPIIVGNIHTYRDFIDISDVIRAYIDLMKGEFYGQIFNICSGVPIQIETILITLLSFSNIPISYVVDPKLVRSDDVLKVYGSFKKLNNSIGFNTKVSIEESLRNSWNYYFNSCDK